VRRLWTPRWLLVHAGVLIGVAGFLALGWWQLGRATNGNLLSYGYAIEWPAFAVFLVWVWIKEIRKVLRSGDASAAVPESGATQHLPAPALPQPVRTTRQRPRSGPAYDDSGDEELAAYNAYLSHLNANAHRTPHEIRRSEENR